MIKKEFSKRKTIKDEILGLSEGEIIPLIKDLFGRSFFNNYEHKERATLLASVILNMSYKELEEKIEFLPLETNQDKAIYNKAICDIVLDIRLPNNPIILIIELNHFSKDLEILANDEKLLKQLKIKPNEIKTRILMKSFYYLNRIYGNQKIRNLEYAKTKKVIAYNLSTFGISEDSYDDIFRFSMSDLKHKIELTDKVEFYNLDVVNMSRTWYNEKYQERNKKERNLILLSNLLITDKLSIAECCIDKF